MASLKPTVDKLEMFIFWSRWLQAPLYLGLIIAQGVYVYLFMLELSHLIQNLFFSSTRISAEYEVKQITGSTRSVSIARRAIASASASAPRAKATRDRVMQESPAAGAAPGTDLMHISASSSACANKHYGISSDGKRLPEDNEEEG